MLNIGPKPDGSLDPTHAARIARVGQWYTRMDGCLEEHEADEFDYGAHKSGNCIVTKKNGKTYFHFYEGTRSTAVAMKNYPGLPRSVRLLNTGSKLPCAIERLSEYFNGKTGVAEHEFLHIWDISVDDLAAEPIILEVEW